MPSWVPAAALWFVAATAAVAGLLALVAALRGLLVLVAIALFASFAIEPAVNRLSLRGWRRGPAVGLVFLVIALAGAALVATVGAVTLSQGTRLAESLPEVVDELGAFASNRLGVDVDTSELTAPGGAVHDLTERLKDQIVEVTAAALAVVAKLLTVAFFTFYLAADGPRFRRQICSLVRPDRQREVLRVWEIAIEKTGGYLYSRFLLALISAAVTAVAFVVIGVDYPLPLAVWVGLVSQLVPVVGAYLAGALPVLVALSSDPGTAVAVVVFLTLYQQVENHFLSPRLTRRTVNLHPALGLGSVIAGAALLGAPGALMAVPVAATVQAFVSTYIHRHDVIDDALVETPAPRPRRSWFRSTPSALDDEPIVLDRRAAGGAHHSHEDPRPGSGASG